jgi:hypothetical protein
MAWRSAKFCNVSASLIVISYNWQFLAGITAAATGSAKMASSFRGVIFSIHGGGAGDGRRNLDSPMNFPMIGSLVDPQ